MTQPEFGIVISSDGKLDLPWATAECLGESRGALAPGLKAYITPGH